MKALFKLNSRRNRRMSEFLSIFATIGLEGRQRNGKKIFRDKIRRKELEVKLKSIVINGERGLI